ncbi:hypothetical protein [Actinomadura citrea]|jgi:mannose/fructose/N-acetylgalactosamine-specific phosphotransferase system component IIC|uniref:Mannose/fructose/N-acetylgalactosamine-specific phosphotransferase system component IIC n=1 Tax=Actinomadura citrea TaxID=46158 RepID=A0A7Y9GJB0_9ACTN|nr:hypothetical protein [Actinomadura citrea]NYE17381.1 mannose/fructose/N-acetylgalactosamine-specific phosphotransferase system component IIC [Actinomadura citrea]GGU00654.1 hypothetical protein GCM10010177_69690 [Actinomadura citrea]
MAGSKITRRQVIAAAAVGAVLAVTRDKDEEQGDTTTPQETPRSGESTEEQPNR